MRIMYMGTPHFAARVLEIMVKKTSGNTFSVITKPDTPKGRSYKMIPCETAVMAESLGLKVYKPENLKEENFKDILESEAPDVIVVAAYGKLLPKAVLESAKHGCINIHGSLLPKYRGAAPIQQAVLNGDKVTGVTAMQMAEGLDTGDILTAIETEIGENETSGELFDRLCILGGDLIITTLDMLENGEIKPIKQDESKATHTSKIDKSLCPIDFTKSAYEVHNKVRGLNPWPVATAELCGKRLKIYSTKICEKSGRVGTIISTKPLIVACGSGSVEIIELQPEGKKRMTAKDYLTGHTLTVGSRVDR